MSAVAIFGLGFAAAGALGHDIWLVVVGLLVFGVAGTVRQLMIAGPNN